MLSRFVAAAMAAAGLAITLHADIDPNGFDQSVKPQDDFYQFVNGTWLATSKIPAEYSRWGNVIELGVRNQENLKTLCERASATGEEGTPAERMVGDFYVSGVDDQAIAVNGAEPLRFEFNRIDALQTKAQVWAEMAHLHGLGVPVGFDFSAAIDLTNPNIQIAAMGQGGLGLPDRDYYFAPEDQKIRDEYVMHIGKMLQLLGATAGDAATQAHAIFDLETSLAEASRKRADRRDPNKNFNRLTREQFNPLASGLDWNAFFTALSVKSTDVIDVGQPEFMKAFAAQFAAVPAETWRAYLRWHFLDTFAEGLSDPFVMEDFHFNGTVLTGTKQILPRWKRVVTAIDESVGEGLGQLYVASYFPPEAKSRALDLVNHLRSELRQRIEGLEWMDAPTKARALEKLDTLGLKIGYPDQWRDYTGLVINRGPYVLNLLKSRAFEERRELRKIGQPPDPGEWSITTPTVNAYYSPPRNEIVFPAGILQPPFFDFKADDAVNYGGIGDVIGHEMTHGFDDQGRKYDPHGKLKDWWSSASAARFDARAARIVAQFDGYSPLPNHHLNGRLTEGENIADLGGLKVAFHAMEAAIGSGSHPKIDGWTPQQRFFLSYANIQRMLVRPEREAELIKIDPHAPSHFRVIGPLSNMDEFFQAFDVPEGAPMRRPAAERVSIW